MRFIMQLKRMGNSVRCCLQKCLQRISVAMKLFLRSILLRYRRIWASIVVHKAEIGYYAVLTLVLVALGSAANDYRSKKAIQQLVQTLPTQDPGISVQTKPDETLMPQIRKPQYIQPVQGSIICGFSDKELNWSTTLQLWQTHPAIDIAATAGEAVYAAADGIIVEMYADALYGNVIAIEHDDGSQLRYCSLNTLQLVKIDQQVRQGDIISAVGTCDAEAELGAHLHLEFLKDQNPMDFTLFLQTEELNDLQN